ncbi:hypothetical protein [Mesorhizobium sp. M0239]|uniref:hypothetical protein n=1 Tax=Mesorhizobium sp. M0239 TaxID=2956924 RepID=UPI003339422C
MDWKDLLTSFDGRINRGKFWAAIGVFIVIGIVAFILDAILGTRITTAVAPRSASSAFSSLWPRSISHSQSTPSAGMIAASRAGGA